MISKHVTIPPTNGGVLLVLIHLIGITGEKLRIMLLPVLLLSLCSSQGEENPKDKTLL